MKRQKHKTVSQVTSIKFFYDPKSGFSIIDNTLFQFKNTSRAKLTFTPKGATLLLNGKKTNFKKYWATTTDPSIYQSNLPKLVTHFEITQYENYANRVRDIGLHFRRYNTDGSNTFSAIYPLPKNGGNGLSQLSLREFLQRVRLPNLSFDP